MFFKFSVLLLQLLALFLLCLIVVTVNDHEAFAMWTTGSTTRAARRQELALRRNDGWRTSTEADETVQAGELCEAAVLT